KRYSGTCLTNPDFVKVAEAFGVAGIEASKKEEVRPAIEKALKINKPVFLNFKVVQEENVFPMVPAGASLKEMISGLA
ncbi:acetolactate synthase large subunit, partial [bacterium]|nr:acetolactate synthase large subunit [bacterium]